MAGTQRRPAWFRREPYPSIVGVLLDHELLREGGRESLHLAVRLVDAHDGDEAAGRSPVDAVIAALSREPSLQHYFDGPLDEAAQAIVDVLVEHRAPADPS